MELLPRVFVEENTLISEGFPIGTISVDSVLRYVDNTVFFLYNVARCEIHLFVEADTSGRILRLYWFQFEEYLPEQPYSYDYSQYPNRSTLGCHEFYEDVGYFNEADTRDTLSDGSDSMHMRLLLEKNGYRLVDGLMFIRLVRLDEAKKRELLIVYMEDLVQHGLCVRDFMGQSGDLRWREVSEGLRMRSLAGIKLDMK